MAWAHCSFWINFPGITIKNREKIKEESKAFGDYYDTYFRVNKHNFSEQTYQTNF